MNTIGSLWVNTDRLIELLNGGIELSHTSVGTIPIHRGYRVIRSEPKGLVIIMKSAMYWPLAPYALPRLMKASGIFFSIPRSDRISAVQPSIWILGSAAAHDAYG